MTLICSPKLTSGVTLVLGGRRSGKSEFGERLVLESGLTPVYLATARRDDAEMDERIEKHRVRRASIAGREWKTIEQPLALGDALFECALDGHAVLVDCLSLWISNLMQAGENIESVGDRLVAGLGDLAAPVVFISSEAGLGVVPDNALAREFLDHAGLMHQKIARQANQVFLMTAGLPQLLKSE